MFNRFILESVKIKTGRFSLENPDKSSSKEFKNESQCTELLEGDLYRLVKRYFFTYFNFDC